MIVQLMTDREAILSFDMTQRERVLDWLAHKCSDFRCAACQSSDWGVCGIVGVDGPVPLVAVGCNNCAYVVHFSAVVLGLTPP
jgi:hypothetical protein